MTASTSSPSGAERKPPIYQKNVNKWLLSIIIILTSFIIAHFYLILWSSKLQPLGSMKNFREPSQDKLESEEARELEFWVHRYVRWHKANRHNASRVAVYMPVRAGLGDNVEGMLNLWGYAVTTNRLFLLAPSTLSAMMSESTKKEFMYNKKEDGKFGPLLGKIRVRSMMLSRAITLLKGPTPVAALSLAGSDRPHEFALRPPRYIYRGQIPDFSENVKRAIAKILLEPSEELIKLKNDFLSSNRMGDGKPYFAYHARLGRGVGEKGHHRFSNVNYTYISECAADKLLRIAERYGIKSRDLRVFLATDTADFRIVFEKAMLKKTPRSRVHYMKNDPTHFRYTRGHSAHAKLQVENIILGDAREIIAFWSGFSKVAQWRGKSVKLHEMYYDSCPHRDLQ